MKPIVMACLWVLALAACGGDEAAIVSLSGDAIPFVGGSDLRVEGAVVTIVEQPDRTSTTGADGRFSFDGLTEGSEVTLQMEQENYHRMQTATLTLGPEGAERVTFQAVHNAIYAELADLLQVVPDEDNKCQIASTVTRVGKSIYDEGAHGEAGATVTLDPPMAEEGPIYFNESVVPDRALTETTADGGVLFLQVPPGQYVLTATKPGVSIRQVAIKCRAGWLANASPPWGLQVE